MDLSALLDWNFLLQVIDLDGGPWQRPAVAFLVLVFFLVLRRLLTHWMLWPLLGGLSRLLRLERSRIDGILRDPATLVPIAAGIYFAARILQFDQWAQDIVTLVVRSIGVFGTTLLMARALRALARESRALASALGEEIVAWGVRLLEILVWLVGAAAILEVWGIRVAPLIASLGILGVAVALGAQDFFKNLISGLVVLSEKRYRTGRPRPALRGRRWLGGADRVPLDPGPALRRCPRSRCRTQCSPTGRWSITAKSPGAACSGRSIWNTAPLLRS